MRYKEGTRVIEAVEKLWKEYQKNTQKIKVRAFSRLLVMNKNNKRKIIMSLGKEQSKLAKSSISTATKGLQDSVKGQFGKKVTEVFDKQKQTLD